ncbi:unnamed protein product [Mytilus edulis]|uniref:C-type lectin domain-containing protein n=1 Tax=Mytilus edulis TaxID=6550 RepID=A0A8S3V2Q2_MYTED|nr:unnamed protein product [Mytilus edulis]
MSTVSISTEKNSDASSASRQVHNASTPAFTELTEQTTKFATTPGAPDIKYPMTLMSSDSHNQLTSYENIIHSTSHEVLNRNINADFPIGLLVGLIVTALVIASVVVLLVVCRFKHKGLFRNKKFDNDSHITKFNIPNFNENAKTSDTKTQTVQNSTYAMHTARENENVFSLSDPDLNNMNINNTSNSEYAVVIKNKQMIDNVTNQQQSQDKENLDVIENEYDGLNHNRPNSFTDRNNTTNIYDTALGVRDDAIVFIQNSTTWNEAFTKCSEQNSKLAVISDVERNRSCDSTSLVHREKQFWIGNFYKLSGRISVKGCYNISNSTMEGGYKTLYQCFVLCSRGMKEVGLFAYKAVFESNCICDHHLHLNHSKDFQMVKENRCSNISLFWWVYTEKNSQKDYHDLRSEIPRENLPYGCERNAENNNSIVFPDYFRFALSSSVNTGKLFTLQEIVLYTLDQLLVSKLNGHIRINQTKVSWTEAVVQCNITGSRIASETDIHQDKQLCKTDILQNQTFGLGTTTDCPILLKLKRLTDRANCICNFKGVTTNALVENQTIINVFKSDKIFMVEVYKKITKFATIPGAPDIKSPMTYISSDLHSHVTKSSKENIVHSTSHEVLNENVNDNSPIGLLVGIIVTALVLVAVIVLLVVCRFKRKGLFRNKLYGDDSRITMFNSPNYKETDITSDSKTQTVQNSTYDMHDMHTANENENGFSLSVPDSNNINNKSNSEYAVVIKNKQIIGNDTNQQQSHD